jgi:hypothetical protein
MVGLLGNKICEAVIFSWPLYYMCSSDLSTVVGKLLLKSSGVTLLPLIVKETSYF